MKLGVEKKEDRWKLYVFGALALVGGWVAYSNLTPDSGSSSGSAAVSKLTAPAPAAIPGASQQQPVRRRPNGRVAGDFRPKLKSERIEDRPDLAQIDPTIKLGLLARVQNISLEGGARNIFQFGIAIPLTPAAPLPKVKPIIPGPTAANTPPPPAVGPPPVQQAPPIPFKYYGYSSVKGETRKRAFFLDGDDIIVAWEGELIKNRYKVLHIGLRSVEMEDTQFRNATQSLQLVEEVAG